MSLFRFIFRALTLSRRPVRYRVVTEKRRSGDASSEVGGVSGVTYARARGLRAASEAAEPQINRVTIVGRCYVIDGDTLVIGDARVRLAGIDAPELDQPYGSNAKWALIALCKDQIVHAVLEGSVSHDRTVATCYLPDGRDLSAEMVKLGMAVDWPKFSGGKYRSLEPPNIRRKLWRCDARQKGRMPPTQAC